ncbi:MAG: DUF4878 domain-containing protein [Agriterribacter sp.]
MGKLSTIAFVFLFIFCSCTQTENYKKPDDPLEAGRDFIRFALDGNMAKAKTFILDDAANMNIFERKEKQYNDASAAEKAAYKDASIIINKSETLNDSTAIINYANSYKKQNSEIKLVKENGEWWVDIKYTFLGDAHEK